MDGPLAPVTGGVKSAHTYLAMYVLGSGTLWIVFCVLTQLDWVRANHKFTLPNGTTVSTCPAAMGELRLPFLSLRSLPEGSQTSVSRLWICWGHNVSRAPVPPALYSMPLKKGRPRRIRLHPRHQLLPTSVRGEGGTCHLKR